MDEFVLRELTFEDMPAYWKLACIAFHGKNAGLEDEKTFLENCAKEEENFRKDATALGNYRTHTGLFRDGKLLSTLASNAFEANFDGNVCELCGIGGVMSDPSARKSGGITQVLSRELEQMRQRGQLLSHLHPFRTSFYRKFGYEHCAHVVEWTIPTDFLPEIPYDIRWYENTPGEQQAVRRIYEAFSAEHNLSVRRSDARWEGRFRRLQPYSGKSFSYLLYGENGPDGFLSYKPEEHPDAPLTILVEQLYYASPKALRQLLAFLGSQRPYVKEVKLRLPVGVDISSWLKEFCSAYDKRNVRRELLHLGSSRVVDVEGVLKLARYEGRGSADICVVDPLCPWNDKCFRVEFADRCLSVTETDRWDIRLTIGAFTALILGAHTLSEAAYLEGVEMAGNAENLRKIFYKKSMWIEENF